MANNTPRGLGKGLGALLGDLPVDADSLRRPVGYINDLTPSADRNGVCMIPADRIDPNPFQPRLSFDKDALDELAASIRNLGLIQPVTLRSVPGGRYQIITGERRFKACCQNGMTEIPAYVRSSDDTGMRELALVENIQRENLDPIELALSYQSLIDECSLTQDQMAARVGKNRATVANTLRLLKLPVKVQHDIKVGLLSQGHAKALLAVEDPELQERLCDRVVAGGLSVRELEALVRRIESGMEDGGKTVKEQPALPEEYSRILSHLGKYFGSEISLRRHASGKGSMTIRFSSDEEVGKFLEALDNSKL